MKDTFISFHLPNFLFSWLKRVFFLLFCCCFFIFLFNGIETWACTLLFVYTYLSHRCLWKRRKRRRAGGRLRKFPTNNVAATWQQHDSRSQPHRVYVSSFLLAQLIPPPIKPASLSQPLHLNFNVAPNSNKRQGELCLLRPVCPLSGKIKDPNPPKPLLPCVYHFYAKRKHAPKPIRPLLKTAKKKKRKRK